MGVFSLCLQAGSITLGCDPAARKLSDLSAATLEFGMDAALIYTGWNRREQVLAALSKLSEQLVTNAYGAALIIPLFAMLGKPERTRELHDQFRRTASGPYVSRFGFAATAFATTRGSPRSCARWDSPTQLGGDPDHEPDGIAARGPPLPGRV